MKLKVLQNSPGFDNLFDGCVMVQLPHVAHERDMP